MGLNFIYVSKYTELNMYFNNQDLCYFHLTIIQLEIGIGISRIGPISVPRVTFDIATSQHRDRIRGDILVQSFGQVTHRQSSKCLVTKRKGKHPSQFSVGRQYYSQIQSTTYPDCSFRQHLPCLFVLR